MRGGGVVLGCWLMMCAGVLAQSPQQRVLEDLLSTGTHAFYAGEAQRAYELLSQAIQAGIKDPRAYYMRGVVLERLGRPQQAARDFRRAAQLEVLVSADPDEVDLFLMRVQGRVRVKLERIRRQVKVEALRRLRAWERARYEALQRRQKEVSIPEGTHPDPLADQSDQLVLPAGGDLGEGASGAERPSRPQTPSTHSRQPSDQPSPDKPSPSDLGKRQKLRSALYALGEALLPKLQVQIPVPVKNHPPQENSQP